jgi:hypothetical protein
LLPKILGERTTSIVKKAEMNTSAEDVKTIYQGTLRKEWREKTMSPFVYTIFGSFLL